MKLKLLTFLALYLGAGLFIALPVQAGLSSNPGSNFSFFGSYSDNFVEIANDGGGVIAEYNVKVYLLKTAGTPVQITGRCDSACTLYLALPNSQLCVSPGAYLRFHAPHADTAQNIRDAQMFLMSKYPKWVRNWIIDQGGLTNQLITMDYDYLKQFLKTCDNGG